MGEQGAGEQGYFDREHYEVCNAMSRRKEKRRKRSARNSDALPPKSGTPYPALKTVRPQRPVGHSEEMRGPDECLA